MRVHGYGGTGFLAKELVQDLMHTPLFQVWDPDAGVWADGCVDVNSWCIVGPGARRGLNRLHGRRVDEDAYSGNAGCQERFMQELLALFEERKGRWGEVVLGHETGKLQLHDVQFQLCEMDKHERAKNGEGAVRPYTPPGLAPQLLFGWRPTPLRNEGRRRFCLRLWPAAAASAARRLQAEEASNGQGCAHLERRLKRRRVSRLPAPVQVKSVARPPTCLERSPRLDPLRELLIANAAEATPPMPAAAQAGVRRVPAVAPVLQLYHQAAACLA